MSCRRITSPITKKEIVSKTWEAIRESVQTDEEADEAYSKLSSPEFIKWFGNWIETPHLASKVVTEDGEPMVVYHGSGQEFSTITTKKEMIFFTTNKEYARIYAKRAAEDLAILKYMAKQAEKNRIKDYIKSEESSYPPHVDALYQYVYEEVKNGATEKEVIDKIKTNSNDLNKLIYQIPNYERGYIQDSGDEYADDPRWEREAERAVEEAFNALPIQEQINLLNEETYKKLAEENNISIIIDHIYHQLETISNLQEQKILDVSKYLSIEPKETIYPLFLNIKNPHYATELLSNEKLAEGKIPLKQTEDGIIGKDDEFYHRVDEKKVYYKEEPVYAIRNSNQAKSIYNVGTFSTQSDNIYYQRGNIEQSKASPETIKKVKEFLSRIGVDIETLDSQRYGGANGIANILENLVGIAEGKEEQALTEEAMHFAVEIMQRNGDPLFKQMFNKISKYKLYDQVREEYDGHKDYTLPDGKPDIVALKKRLWQRYWLNTTFNRKRVLQISQS